MKNQAEQIKTKLYETIADIEKHSQVEIVVAVKQRSSAYSETTLWWGIVFTFLSFTFFMFYPVAFTDLLIYLGTIGAFLFGTGLCLLVKPLQRLSISRESMKKKVEILARAMFQKGGIGNTIEKTGVFVLVSKFEKQVIIIPDSGVKNAVPPEEWKKMCKEFHSIFKEHDFFKALINRLANHKPVFNKYLPPIEGDINELPDDLEIEL